MCKIGYILRFELGIANFRVLANLAWGHEFQGLRPMIPKHTNPMLVELMESCWQQDASLRPEFSDIVKMLRQMARRVREKL